MKALLLRAVVLARRHRDLAASTRREYRRRLDHALDAVMALAPSTRDGKRLRRRYGKVRSSLFTFLDHPEIAADNNSSERELRPTATYRKVTGGFRSDPTFPPLRFQRHECRRILRVCEEPAEVWC